VLEDGMELGRGQVVHRGSCAEEKITGTVSVVVRVPGAVVIGDQALSFPLQELIETRADLGSGAARLRAAGAPVPALVRSLWCDWQAARA